MVQKFSGEVGQVAGRDVKSSNAQANVNIHLHNGAESRRYISDRQRRAIAAKVFELEAQTGVEKLIVYRRLMTRFKFQSMDEMPRDLFERVVRYLDGWLRNGTADQAAASHADPASKEGIPAAPSQVAPIEQQASGAALAPLVMEAELVHAPRQKKQTPWLAISLTVAGTVSLLAVLSVVAHRPRHDTQLQTAAPPPHCEYAGNRYTLGSIVKQEGLRQRCEATGDNPAEWQPLASVGRR
ncbi:alpha/beta hydrolase [Paraburkholderia sp. EG304]|uniref:alpha/beta hydrolase n=1 Tax=Paraburkholderia sp. EG304 TaxID=3237015 RepID=UPI00397E0EA0